MWTGTIYVNNILKKTMSQNVFRGMEFKIVQILALVGGEMKSLDKETSLLVCRRKNKDGILLIVDESTLNGSEEHVEHNDGYNR